MWLEENQIPINYTLIHHRSLWLTALADCSHYKLLLRRPSILTVSHWRDYCALPGLALSIIRPSIGLTLIKISGPFVERDIPEKSPSNLIWPKSSSIEDTSYTCTCYLSVEEVSIRLLNVFISSINTTTLYFVFSFIYMVCININCIPYSSRHCLRSSD